MKSAPFVGGERDNVREFLLYFRPFMQSAQWLVVVSQVHSQVALDSFRSFSVCVYAATGGGVCMNACMLLLQNGCPPPASIVGG